ncbi:NAD(P)/FAD-dependent oxidoreductase [[Clostridium] leptum]|uniref:NAD(P)/FAD-dependent oxidoreductase n=1 Tax=[Clostridium] leptum TaxID=1535 RepID=A0A412AXL3_9FIRM|nr:NAD(P)/FAD-dependent oxidoreductase [[Clostridium] leptum]
MKYVLIGNSAAAVACVEGIRQRDREGDITMVTNEPYHTYSRPLISYLLAEKTDRERMKYRPDDFYKKNRCELIAGVSADHLEPKRKTVVLSDGRELPYDRLLVAAGSSPAVPPIKGLEAVENMTTFLSLDDALRLEKMLTPFSRVLIMGAGLIGLKCAEGIAGKAKSITVVDMADHILPSILDQEASIPVQRRMEEHGIEFVLSDAAQELQPDRAVLKSGRDIRFDILVMAVGVRPNVRLVQNAGGAVKRGIVTDSRGQTSIPDVYAAGDCTESRDITTGEEKVLALLPNAYLQGECAGINMAGGNQSYDKAIPMNSIGFFGLHLMTAGSCGGEAYLEKNGGNYKKLFVRENRLAGYILIGDVARAGIYTSLIREQTPLSALDFELIRQKPQLMAFSRTKRNEMLGGNVG